MLVEEGRVISLSDFSPVELDLLRTRAIRRRQHEKRVQERFDAGDLWLPVEDYQRCFRRTPQGRLMPRHLLQQQTAGYLAASGWSRHSDALSYAGTQDSQHDRMTFISCYATALVFRGFSGETGDPEYMKLTEQARAMTEQIKSEVEARFPKPVPRNV